MSSQSSHRDPSSRPDPAETIDAYLKGEPTAFGEIDGWIRQELRMRYRSLTHEHEDVCQTVHGKLVTCLREGRYQGQSTLRTYVVGITHHTSIDRLRARYRERAFAETAEPPPGGEPAANPYDTVEARDENRLLHQMVQSLPDHCKELWRMVFLDKLPYDEIGRQLAIPPGTVKSRMWHCRKKATDLVEKLRRMPRRAARFEPGPGSSRPGQAKEDP